MEAFVNFIKEYGVLILSAVSVLVSTICIIVKQRPKTVDEFFKVVSDCLNEVPSLCAAAEKIVGNGQGAAKRSVVLSSLSCSVSKALGRSLTASEESFIAEKGALVLEATLKAPQRKEVGHFEKTK